MSFNSGVCLTESYVIVIRSDLLSLWLLHKSDLGSYSDMGPPYQIASTFTLKGKLFNLKSPFVNNALIASCKQALILLNPNVYRCCAIRNWMQIAPLLGWSYTLLDAFSLFSPYLSFLSLPHLFPLSPPSVFLSHAKAPWNHHYAHSTTSCTNICMLMPVFVCCSN